MVESLTATLHSVFGFPTFRPGQREVLELLLAGRHTLAVMPTGAGKSLIYQLAAFHRPGTTVVISPLIALMKDQVDGLRRRGVRATTLNSLVPMAEQTRRLDKLAAGGYRLVYVAPERLRQRAFVAALASARVTLLAVDEAHCISQWGHDFRPDYLRLRAVRQALGDPLTVALTATATPDVQDDILQQLGLTTAARVVTGFNRPNLTLEVQSTPDVPDKLRALRDLLVETPHGAVLVYVGTRREAEEGADFIREVVGRAAHCYHAGLDPDVRHWVQEGFMAGDINTVVATNAFGMGIDRADVRLVVHFALPGTLEAYYQEAGRAGRDGQPARAVLLYAPHDRALQKWFIDHATPSLTEVRTVYETLTRPAGTDISATSEALSLGTSLGEVQVRLALALLERSGVVERLGDDGLTMTLRPQAWRDEAVRDALRHEAERRDYRCQQLAKMVAYAESDGCRRRILLDHFGDPQPATADRCCDNCLAAQPPTASAAVPDMASLTRAERIPLIILDTVHRLRSPVGRDKLACLLRGSSGRKVRQAGLDRSVYYGRLKVFTLHELEGMIDQLVRQGYLKAIGSTRPVLRLTPHGREAIRQRSSILLHLPHSEQAIAQRQAQQAAGGTIALTVDLFRQGTTPLDIAQQRGLSVTTVYGHLAGVIERGGLDVTAVVPAETVTQIRAAIDELGDMGIAALKARLPDTISYEAIRCVVAACRCERMQQGEVTETQALMLEAVAALPGRLTRTDVARLLSGTPRGRVESLQAHPLFGRYPRRSHHDLRDEVDRLIGLGYLALDEQRRLAPGALCAGTRTAVTVMPNEVRHLLCQRPQRSPLTPLGVTVEGAEQTSEASAPPVSPVQTPHSVQSDGGEALRSGESPTLSPPPDHAITAFLSRPHARPLPGPWQAGWALDSHSRFAGADWSRTATGELAYRLKYGGETDALAPLVEQAVSLCQAQRELMAVDIILPVPPSTPRAFDPVAALAQALSQRLDRPTWPGLVKTRQTAPQKEMRTLAQKRANVAGAFAARGPLRGRRVLVVDDLFDSGATLDEVTRVLFQAGASQVYVLTLTRTIHSDA